jgi:NADH:ubiquinone oxidoreductase subunit 3 (subunit A)
MDAPFHAYLVLAVLLVFAMALPCVLLTLAYVVSPKKPGPTKQATYECGLEAKGDPWGQFKVQYYLYALAFVIFDIESVFLYPWAAAFSGLGLGGYLAMMLFGLILAESLIYLWWKGVLRWD